MKTAATVPGRSCISVRYTSGSFSPVSPKRIHLYPGFCVDDLKKVRVLEIIRIERLLGVAVQDRRTMRQPEAVERLRDALVQRPRAAREVENGEFWVQAHVDLARD